MARHLNEAQRQDHRGIETTGDQADAAAEEPPCHGCRGQRAEHAQKQARQANGGRRHAEDLQRGGDRPKVEDWLVEKWLAEQVRHRPIAALDHLLRNRGVQPFVGIDQGNIVCNQQWAKDAQGSQKDQDQQAGLPTVVRHDAASVARIETQLDRRGGSLHEIQPWKKGQLAHFLVILRWSSAFRRPMPAKAGTPTIPPGVLYERFYTPAAIFRQMAWAISRVPTAVGSSRRAFMS